MIEMQNKFQVIEPFNTKIRIKLRNYKEPLKLKFKIHEKSIEREKETIQKVETRFRIVKRFQMKCANRKW